MKRVFYLSYVRCQHPVKTNSKCNVLVKYCYIRHLPQTSPFNERFVPYRQQYLYTLCTRLVFVRYVLSTYTLD